MLTFLVVYFVHTDGHHYVDYFTNVTDLDTKGFEDYSTQLGHKIIAWRLF